MRRRIAIIGTGYVGLTIGLCLAQLGHEITCMDKDEDKINELRNGRIPIYEPGLREILYRKRINFSTNLEKTVKENEVIFICVNTPSQDNDKVDLSYFKRAIKDISEIMENYKVIVNKSTVPVRTGEWTEKEIKKNYRGNFAVVSNPEFLREGSAVQDFMNPDRVVIGTEDEKAKDIMLDIYSAIEAPKVITGVRSAELIKYVANAFLGTKISFINEIANICERVGGNVEEVAKGIGLDKRIGPKFLNAGIGYGGSCFPKDISGLVKIADDHKYDFKLLKSVLTVNKYQKTNFVKKIREALEKTEGNTVAIWGLAFKPNTDDVRKSPALEIIRNLSNDGCKIKAYDPQATENAKEELESEGINIEYCKSSIEAAKDSNVLALTTEWPEFTEVDLRKVKESMAEPYFLDGRNLFETEKMQELGFRYQGIGEAKD